MQDHDPELTAADERAPYTPRPGWYGVLVCTSCGHESEPPRGASKEAMFSARCAECGATSHHLHERQESARLIWEHRRRLREPVSVSHWGIWER